MVTQNVAEAGVEVVEGVKKAGRMRMIGDNEEGRKEIAKGMGSRKEEKRRGQRMTSKQKSKSEPQSTWK